MTNEKITIDDIARDLGISKTTVSRAISGKGRIGKETVRRVQEYIKEHDYHPSAIAKSLANSKAYNIAFVMSGDYGNTDLPFFQKCLWGLSNKVSDSEYDVIICIVSDNDISRLEQLVENKKIDAAVLGRTIENDTSVDYLKNHGIPFITIGSVSDDDVIQIDNDHEGGCGRLTKYLIESENFAGKISRGRMAFIGGDSTFIVNQSRTRGFVSACTSAGLTEAEEGKEDGDYMIFPDATDSVLVKKSVKLAIEAGAKCIVCGDDIICAEVLYYLDKNGIVIPKEMCVASFYDSDVLANHTPSITALNIDIEETGRSAGEMILDLMEGKSVESRKLLGTNLIVRKST